MKLQQLRYIVEVSRRNLNVSDAADALFTSQPGISKQIKLLEEELGVQIFVRSGKRVTSVTQPGQHVLALAEKILHDVASIKRIGHEFLDHDTGTLTVATTHTQAKYVLPKVVAAFMAIYPAVKLNIKQGSPEDMIAMVSDGLADFAIATEALDDNFSLRKIPYGCWTHSLFIPKNHPLTFINRPIELTDLSAYPLLTYDFTFAPNSSITKAFAYRQISLPKVALTSGDTDVLKTYVKLGLGVGLMASEAYDVKVDSDLTIINLNHLFGMQHAHVVLHPNNYLRGYTYAFLNLLESSLTHEKIDQILYAPAVEDFSI